MTDERRIYSIGYEKRTIDGLVGALADEGVEVLVDVRLTPWSRRPGFSRSQLTEALERHGIEYQHAPLLGNPPENREPFRNGNVKLGRKRFHKRLTNGSAGAMEALSALVGRKPVAIMCVEDDEDRCHRQVIVEVLCIDHPTLAVARL